MFHQFFFIFLIFASIFGASTAWDDDDRIVVKAERPMALRTRRPIKYVPFGKHRETWYK